MTTGRQVQPLMDLALIFKTAPTAAKVLFMPEVERLMWDVAMVSR